MPMRSLLTTVVFTLWSLSLPAHAHNGRPHWQLFELENGASLRGSAIGPASLWVTGTSNSVFRSVNNGKSWQDISVLAEPKLDFRDIEVFDDQTAIVMSVGDGTQSRLYLTDDGGKQWQLLFENPDEKGFFDSIDFWDRDRGVLLGDPVDGYYVVMVTEDGGRHWQRVAREALPALHDREAAFAASGNTLITGSDGKAWFTTGGFAARVYKSNDYGRSWDVSEVPLHRENQTSGGYALSLNHLGDVFVMGGDYTNRSSAYPNLAKYKNEQWQLADNGQRGLRTAMGCIESTCIATGKTGSEISFNNGQSWRVLPGPGFYTLSAGNGLLLGAGADGAVGILPLQAP
ncbi:WD40/YVTN/BNR-like repeat-containing protein [Microbulbifer elongatus]|uniref:WD40/YVTN/BNR-like repeat-containing protein n=1 Tax=Microbulbifer elongatus TaxID=86173 RepID=UPI001CFCD516|nr:YCF48-related protein [Microbulbifer elongatus]